MIGIKISPKNEEKTQKPKFWSSIRPFPRGWWGEGDCV